MGPGLIAARADRFAVIVDAAAYYRAFVEAVERAERSVLVLAWDFDSELELVRSGGRGESPRLVAVLGDRLERRWELEVHVLCWDFSVIYSFQREPLQRFKMGWSTHDRLHFRFDGCHPAGASHHEKIVVVDDRVAFVGGIDLGRRRWDTRDHLPSDLRRRAPDDRPYPPFHDLQAVLSGDAARALGDHARARWLRASGVRLEPVECTSDPWPPSVSVELEDLDLRLVRTRAAHGDDPGVLETEAHHRQAIAGARDTIYIENQFLTSEAVADALAERLAGTDPPEVVVVTTRRSHGWLEHTTMDRLRAGVVRRLRAADRQRRFGLYAPVVGEVGPHVHSKLLLVDDRLAYLGSANLSSRSMRLDTECGVAISGSDSEPQRAAVAALRHRLLGEHLGVAPRRVAEAEAARGLLGAVEALRGGERTLEPLACEEEELPPVLEPIARIADPVGPVDLLDTVRELLAPDRDEDR